MKTAKKMEPDSLVDEKERQMQYFIAVSHKFPFLNHKGKIYKLKTNFTYFIIPSTFPIFSINSCLLLVEKL